jgi:hypothetical protein
MLVNLPLSAATIWDSGKGNLQGKDLIAEREDFTAALELLPSEGMDKGSTRSSELDTWVRYEKDLTEGGCRARQP